MLGVHVTTQRHGQGYQHPEAYCLMTYRSQDGSVEEVIWNSRDGVTPFVVHSESGVEMAHVNWDSDLCAPDYKPLPGQRVFVDMDEELATKAAWESVERYWDHPEYPARGRYPSKEAMAEIFTKEYLGGVTIIKTEEA